MNKKLFFVAALFSFCFLSCAEKKLKTSDFTITKSDGTSVVVNAEIADTYETRQHGFMERKNIPDGTGMLFVFENDQILSFWMKNTPTPLSIAYIDSKGKIRNIFDMEPYSLANITSTVSVRYALEVPQGWFSKVGIKEGDSIILKQNNPEPAPYEIEAIEPESSNLTSEKKSSIKIRSSKSGEKVFLNGNFQGKTPVTINGLISGIYFLQVGDREKVQISTENSRLDEYYFE